ncbi:MAG TPA: Rid family hydrolase [Burkholderiaceae bacterium]
MRKLFISIACLCAPYAVYAAPASTIALDKSAYHRNPAYEREYGYSAAVRSGDTLHVSGVAGRGPMPAALERVYGNLRDILAAHGLDFRHVVKETLYATDLDAVAANKAVRMRYLDGEQPASSWIGVTRLVHPEAVLEVEITAMFPPAMAAPTSR